MIISLTTSFLIIYIEGFRDALYLVDLDLEM